MLDLWKAWPVLLVVGVLVLVIVALQLTCFYAVYGSLLEGFRFLNRPRCPDCEERSLIDLSEHEGLETRPQRAVLRGYKWCVRCKGCYRKEASMRTVSNAERQRVLLRARTR